jgi:KDO2-lipid IV(A) lauroyltransferase
MLPAWVVRDADGRFRCMFDEPVYVPRDGDRDATIAQATQKMAAHLETKIREYPHLWYQFYPFWETQPSDAASEEARAPLKNVRRTP